jgi:hypothetical protein
LTRAPNMQLPHATWPEEDRKRWCAANRSGADPFDDYGPAAHLAEPSRRAFQASYGRFLGFVSSNHPHVLDRPPDMRLDRDLIAGYVAFRRRTCSEAGIAIDLHHLRLALCYICPTADWSWLATITKRISARAKPRPQKHHLITSERLYALGIELMDRAVASAGDAEEFSKADAFSYRDGLLIALLALIAPRRRAVAALRIGWQLIKYGDLWELDLPAQDIKTRRLLTIRSRSICHSASICTWQNSVAASPVQTNTRDSGRPIWGALWMPGRSTTPLDDAPTRPLGSRSICIAFDPPQGPSGQSTTR